MMKISPILQFFFHQRNKSPKPIIHLVSQLKFSPQNSNQTFALLPLNTPSTTETSNFSSTAGTNTSKCDLQTQPNNPDNSKKLPNVNKSDKNEELSKVVTLDKNEELSKVVKLDKNEELSKVDKSDKSEELSKVVKFLRSKGCSSKDIKDKCLSYISSTHSSYVKAMLLSELHLDLPLLMPLMACSLSSLRMAAQLSR